MSRAEYMREYRARKRNIIPAGEVAGLVLEAALRRIAELEAEVAHLKRQLAARVVGTSIVQPVLRDGSFNSRPFTPAPKKGK